MQASRRKVQFPRKHQQLKQESRKKKKKIPDWQQEIKKTKKKLTGTEHTEEQTFFVQVNREKSLKNQFIKTWTSRG